MNTVQSSVFRLSVHKTLEPTRVMSRKRVLGDWYPGGLDSVMNQLVELKTENAQLRAQLEQGDSALPEAGPAEQLERVLDDAEAGPDGEDEAEADREQAEREEHEPVAAGSFGTSRPAPKPAKREKSKARVGARG